MYRWANLVNGIFIPRYKTTWKQVTPLHPTSHPQPAQGLPGMYRLFLVVSSSTVRLLLLRQYATRRKSNVQVKNRLLEKVQEWSIRRFTRPSLEATRAAWVTVKAA